MGGATATGSGASDQPTAAAALDSTTLVHFEKKIEDMMLLLTY